MSQVAQVITPDARPPGRRRHGVLANPEFARLWAGQSVSLIGSQVTTFSLPLVAVLTLKVPVFDIGVLFALRFAPVTVLSLFAGVWLDRRGRRPVLIASALGNAVLIGLVPIAFATGWLTIGLLYAITALSGTLSMVFDVGALTYVPHLVDPDQLTDANSKIQGSTALAGVCGPGLAGLLIGLITAPVTMSVDAVSYLFAAAGLISIRKPEPEPEAPAEHASVWQSITEGLRAVYGNKLLSALLTEGTAINLFFGSYTAVFAAYAIRYLHLSPFEFGIVMAASAAGSLAGATTTTRTRKALGLGRTMAINTVGVSTALLLLLIPRHASLPTMIILVTAQLIFGWNIAVFNVNAITLRQVLTPRRVLARMNATYRMLLWGSVPFGTLLGGLLGSTMGLRSAFMISLLTMTSPLLWLFFSPAFQLKQMPTGPAPDATAAATAPANA